jgi:hypothetical protein
MKMTPTTIVPAGNADRRPSICAKSGIGASINHLIAAGIITTFCVAGVAIAAPAGTDFGGRWQSKKPALTLDISRCGDGWCGVTVTSGSTCGGTVLRLDAGEQGKDTTRLVGSLQLAQASQPYGVQANLYRRDNGQTLLINGHTGGRFQFPRRTYDFQAEFVRINDPSCQPNPRVS